MTAAVFAFVLGAGDAAGRGVLGVAAGVVESAGACTWKVYWPLCHTCARFEALISSSIGIRRGFAGAVGSTICLPLMNN